MSEEEITFEVSSGNIFADLGFENPEEELAKADLVIAMSKTMKARGLNQVKAAKLMEIDQPTLSKLLRGRTSNFTLDRLTRMLTALGGNVRIYVDMPDCQKEDSPIERGHLTVRLAG